MQDKTSAASRRLSPAILRVAGWPIEAIETLRSTALAERIDSWISNDDAIRREGEGLALVLYKLIPRLGERKTRGLVLELKRHLHRTTDPPSEDLLLCILKDDTVVRTLGDTLHAMKCRRAEHVAERAGIEDAYRAEIERADSALEQLTSSDCFLRALCVASPSTFARWQQAQGAQTDRRSRRRLQRTLHRYLMRAIGRATPNGLWAGVALENMTAEPTASLQLRPATPTVRVTPSLSLLARALNSLNRREPWIEEVIWRRNPTLRRIDAETWEFGAFAEDAWCVRRIAHHAQLDLLVERMLPTDAVHFGEIEQVLRTNLPEMTPSSAREVIKIWISAGVIWSQAAFPAFFTDPWKALDATIDVLPAGERPIWRDCRDTLARVADKIEKTVNLIDPRSLRDLLREAQTALVALLERYQAVMSSEENPLIIDRSAPFEFSISNEMTQTIEQNLRTYWNFDRFGLGELETQIAMRELLGEVLAEKPIRLADFLTRGAEIDLRGSLSWQERVLSRANPMEAESVRRAFARWDQEIRPAADGNVHHLRANDADVSQIAMPAGSALLLVGLLNGDTIFRIGGITPEPCFFYSRFSRVLGRNRDELDEFQKWQTATTGEIVQKFPRLRFEDLAVRNFNLNVAARPRFASEVIDPLDGASRLLCEAAISRDHRGRPVISLSDGKELLLPWARSAALLAGLDRFASVLASVSFLLGRPSLMAPMPRLDQEIGEWHHLPRLLLGKAVVSPERWTPEPSTGAMLANARGADRLIAWRRFVRQTGLPDLIYIFVGKDHTESLLAVDSAIGVEFLGEELKAQGSSLRMQELFPGPDAFFARDGEGKRYLAELAVAWAGDEAFWRDYSGSSASGE